MRFHWFEAETDPYSPLDWRQTVVLILPVFLNCFFWLAQGNHFRLWPPAILAVMLAAASLLVTGLFFIGPAYATNSAGQPIAHIVENSLGSIPAIGFRLVCVLFLVLWIARVMEIPNLLLGPLLREPLSLTEELGYRTIVLIFLFGSALQSSRIAAQLALFSGKLGVAILIAASFRVREGWPILAENLFLAVDVPSVVAHFWQGLAILTFNTAPVALFAGGFGYRTASRRQVHLLAIFGVFLPLFLTLFWTGIIDSATGASSLYQPSLDSTVAMALSSRASRVFLPALLLALSITVFGVARFGIRSLVSMVSSPTLSRRSQLLILTGFIAAIAGCMLHYGVTNYPALDLSVHCLVVICAVVMARKRMALSRKFDWVGMAALSAGLVAPFFLPKSFTRSAYGIMETWWHPWLLPSYAIAFGICFCLRTVQERFMSTAPMPNMPIPD